MRNMKSTPDGNLVMAESGVNKVGLVLVGSKAVTFPLASRATPCGSHRTQGRCGSSMTSVVGGLFLIDLSTRRERHTRSSRGAREASLVLSRQR